MAETDKLKKEYEKLTKLSKQYSGVLRTTRDPSQQQRVSKDLQNIDNQLAHIQKQVSPEEFESWKNGDGAVEKKVKRQSMNDYKVLSKVPMKSPGPGSESNEVNVLYSVVLFFEEQFFPVISDKYIKLDFTLGQERDAFYNRLENVKRNQRNLVNTLEDMTMVTRESQKEQLRDMKLRNSRYFVNEAASFARAVVAFWKPIYQDIKEDGHRCMNPKDPVNVDKNLEQDSILDGILVERVIELLILLMEETIEHLNLPEFH